MYYPVKTETEVVDHGNKWTVFLPNREGVDVFKRGVHMSCEIHKYDICTHVDAIMRATERGELTTEKRTVVGLVENHLIEWYKTLDGTYILEMECPLDGYIRSKALVNNLNCHHGRFVVDLLNSQIAKV